MNIKISLILTKLYIDVKILKSKEIPQNIVILAYDLTILEKYVIIKQLFQKKGGIIIESESKNVLLKKVFILMPITIFGMIILSNASYATKDNAITTKERIKEIKIVEEPNIDILIRNKKANIINALNIYKKPIL